MDRRFTKKEKEAVKAYYFHRRLRFDKSKDACLEAIAQVVRTSRKICSMQACAGTFWFGWKDGITTTHSESNWWRMKKVLRTNYCFENPSPAGGKDAAAATVAL